MPVKSPAGGGGAPRLGAAAVSRKPATDKQPREKKAVAIKPKPKLKTTSQSKSKPQPKSKPTSRSKAVRAARQQGPKTTGEARKLAAITVASRRVALGTASKTKAAPRSVTLTRQRAIKADATSTDTTSAVATVAQDVRGEAHAPAASKTKRKAAPKAISLVLKVLTTIDGELTKLEEHSGKSSQDRERASRALSQMVTSLERTVDMQRQIARDKNAANGGQDKEAMRNADDMRRRLIERVERLAQQKRSVASVKERN